MIKPLSDRVLISTDAPEEKTEGGIILLESDQEIPQRGVVVAVGPGSKHQPVTVKVGEIVMYPTFSGIPLTIKGNSYLMMRESEILAVI
jgi:chaperonin GroES